MTKNEVDIMVEESITQNERRERDFDFVIKTIFKTVLQLDHNDLEGPHINIKDLNQICNAIREILNLGEKKIDAGTSENLMNDITHYLLQLKDSTGQPKYDPYIVLKFLEQSSNLVPNTDSGYTITDDNKNILNNVALSLNGNISPHIKTQILGVLEEKFSEEEKEKEFLKYASPGYKALYQDYKGVGDEHKLEKIQQIQFVKNNENGLVEIFFLPLGIYLSEQLLDFDTDQNAQKIIETYKSSYMLPKISDLEKIINICPGDDREDDFDILEKILPGNVERLFVEESFDPTSPMIYGINGERGDKTIQGKNKKRKSDKAYTYGIRYTEKSKYSE